MRQTSALTVHTATSKGNVRIIDALSSGWPVTLTTASVQDTDWRKFLRDHWLQNKNMLNPNYADEFMKVFMAAQQVRKAKQHKDVAKVQPSPCAQSFRTEEKKKEEKPAKLYPDEIIKGKRGTWVQLTLF